MVFDPPAGGGSPPWRTYAVSSASASARYLATRRSSPSPTPAGSIGPSGGPVRASTSPPMSRGRDFRRPGVTGSWWNGRASSTRSGSIAPVPSGRSRWWRVWRGAAGRSATKTHHCMVDGIGSVDVAYVLLDSEPEGDAGAAPRPPAGAEQPAAPDEAGLTARGVGAVTGVASRGASIVMRPIRGALGMATHPDRAREAVHRSRAGRADRPRRADRSAPHQPQRADRRQAPARRSLGRARRAARDPGRARRHRQRRRPGRAAAGGLRAAPGARGASRPRRRACGRWSP